MYSARVDDLDLERLPAPDDQASTGGRSDAAEAPWTRDASREIERIGVIAVFVRCQPSGVSRQLGFHHVVLGRGHDNAKCVAARATVIIVDIACGALQCRRRPAAHYLVMVG